MREFARFPWRLYRGDPCWTPPLTSDLLGSRLLGMAGLLTSRHPYHKFAKVTHFMAWRGKEPVGRVSVAINLRYNDYHHMLAASFGFFDVINDREVAYSLLDKVTDWARDRGMEVLLGPGGYSNATYERQGVLIEGFEHPPTVELTHNAPYYDDLLSGYGFKKRTDYYAYRTELPPERLHSMFALTEKIKKRIDLETRPLSFKRFAEDVQQLASIFNRSWTENWGFLPITDEEASIMAKSLRVVVDPNLIRFAYVGGEPAAMLWVLPDPNYCLKPRWRWNGDSDAVRLARLLLGRRRIPRVRVIALGVLPAFRNKGIEAVLATEALAYGAGRHYRSLEASLMLESNSQVLHGVLELIGGKHYKTWRIYELPL